MVKFYESDKIDYSDSVKNYYVTLYYIFLGTKWTQIGHLAETLGWSKQ